MGILRTDKISGLEKEKGQNPNLVTNGDFSEASIALVGLHIMPLSVMIVVPVEELKLMIVQEQVDGVMLPM